MKRLVVCCDGTWNSLEKSRLTNVALFGESVAYRDGDIQQIVYYDEGVGTAGGVDKLRGGAFGAGIDRNICEAYKFLALNYEAGDEVYVLGFSRGAYTVRSLCGMINTVGLLVSDSLELVHLGYRLYRERLLKPSSSTVDQFRTDHSRPVEITALLCWDTVGALGVPEIIPFDDHINSEYRFHDERLGSIIRNAFHAVSIDEKRVDYDVTPMKRDADQTINLEQVWFPGVHSGIGGGLETNEGRILALGPLAWMMDRARTLGLKFDDRIPSDIQGLGLSMLDGIPKPPEDWFMMPINDKVPLKMKIFGTRERNINAKFEDIHESAKLRWQRDPNYRPANLAATFAEELNNWSP